MRKILVIRNDKIGDFMVCFPAFALLKQSAPDLHITALVPGYTAPLAQLCPSIDEIIIDTADKKSPSEQARIVQAVRNGRFDAVISFVSDWYNAKLVWKSGIKYRLAPATKLFQFLYNHRLTQRRSRSEKAEFEYNLDLARAFLQDQGISAFESNTPYLQFSAEEIAKQRTKLTACLGLNDEKKWLFVHSGSGGSANNLSLAQYAELVQGILHEIDCQVVLTAGSPVEAEKSRELSALINDPRVVVYGENDGLQDFARSIACADLFIAGSTGPLHIAGALNKAIVGFYPSRLSAIPRRWRPINDPEKFLAFTPPSGRQTEKNLTLIDIALALTRIIPFVQSHFRHSDLAD